MGDIFLFFAIFVPPLAVVSLVAFGVAGAKNKKKGKKSSYNRKKDPLFWATVTTLALLVLLTLVGLIAKYA